jgi:hybrid polyketide synthase/nonribosomal peptide synthetase FtdB
MEWKHKKTLALRDFETFKIENEPPKLAFVFSGMGPQQWNMGRGLLNNAAYYQTIAQCDVDAKPLFDVSLMKELTREETVSNMGDTRIAQPANFALQIGLAALWQSWGVQPDIIVGHSSGEVAAAYCAQVLTLKDALKIIFHRGRLQARFKGKGGLLAAALSIEEATGFVHEYQDAIDIAAVNSPVSVTLCGNTKVLIEIMNRLRKRRLFGKLLKVDVPYHSRKMQSIRQEFIDSLNGLTPNQPKTRIFSTVAGRELIDGTRFSPFYWWDNIQKPALFSQAIAQISQTGPCVFLEISAHPVLTRSIKECLQYANRVGLTLPSLRHGQDDLIVMLQSLAALQSLDLTANRLS